MLGRNLLAVVPTVRQVRPRSGGERFRGYQGIGVRIDTGKNGIQA
jgi:hypothetical protein